MTRNTAILIFDEVEVLDFCGPFEVFGVAGRGLPDKAFNVYTVAEKARPVIARNGLSVNPAYTLSDCPQPDILLIPGGRGTRTEMHNAVLLEWIKRQYPQVELLLSVCTGSLILGRAGLLNGLSATTHHAAMNELREAAPDTTICPEDRFVDNGKIVTSAGVSAGIDMALYIVARLLGTEESVATARHMQYDYWTPERWPITASS
ncbi:MAG: DJ-1/PfpI family protein [Anaerolineae bacterium]|nr:DJ-1/PfpI family protein [Anaerolineae bacterium]